MAFNDVAVKDGIGEVWRLDVSLDKFVTIAYRYATQGFVLANNVYDGRILKLSPLTRQLGEDNFLQPNSVSLEIANEDELADWLCTAGSSSYLVARFRLYVGLFELPASPGALDPANIQWKQQGEFVCGNSPSMTAEAISLQLDSFSPAAFDRACPLPTFYEWWVYDATNLNPLRTLPGGNLSPSPEIANQTVQLAWGDDWVQCRRVGKGITSDGLIPFVVCATKDTGASPATEIDAVMLHFAGSGSTRQGYVVPETITWAGVTYTVWTSYRSATVTAGDGTSWKIVLLGFNADALQKWVAQSVNPIDVGAHISGIYDLEQNHMADVWVRGYPLSARTATSGYTQHPADVLTDLATHYASVAVPLNAASIARYRTQTPGLSAAGCIGGWSSGGERTIREHLSDLASTFDSDIFPGADGELRATVRDLDYTGQTATLVELVETRISDVRQSVPERELRNAPFNRIEYMDAKVRPHTHPAFRGEGSVAPLDFWAEQAAWGRVLPRRMSARWRRWDFRDGVEGRNADATIRPVVEFVAGAEAYQLEVGDYFKLTWTRNHSDPYSAAIFRVDGLDPMPLSGQVRVRAVWSDDLRTTARPFLLDDETYLTRVSSGGGRTATVVDASTTVTFSSGSLITDGVAAGDHLILKDATESSTGFARNRALKIASITDATRLVISDADLAFGAGAGLAVAAWEIRRSHLTFPTVASDPANYPDGGDMYGRVSDSSATPLYSANGTGGFTTAHKLRDG